MSIDMTAGPIFDCPECSAWLPMSEMVLAVQRGDTRDRGVRALHRLIANTIERHYTNHHPAPDPFVYREHGPSESVTLRDVVLRTYDRNYLDVVKRLVAPAENQA